MASEIAQNYRTIVNHLSDLIQVSGYRNDYIAQKIGLSPANFAMKKKRGGFTMDQVEHILKVIENEDVEDHLMLEIMRSREDDPTISLEELEKQMGW